MLHKLRMCVISVEIFVILFNLFRASFKSHPILWYWGLLLGAVCFVFPLKFPPYLCKNSTLTSSPELGREVNRTALFITGFMTRLKATQFSPYTFHNFVINVLLLTALSEDKRAPLLSRYTQHGLRRDVPFLLTPVALRSLHFPTEIT